MIRLHGTDNWSPPAPKTPWQRERMTRRDEPEQKFPMPVRFAVIGFGAALGWIIVLALAAALLK